MKSVLRKFAQDYAEAVNPCSLSFATSSSTFSTWRAGVQQQEELGANELTLPPPTRLGGSVTLTVSRRGVKSIPKSPGEYFSIGFFFAFIMLGNEA